MNRLQLEHIIRVAGAISQDDELLVFGSQAVLGQYPDAPPLLLRSMEADICPLNYPDKVDLIDGSIGEGSPFESSFGYYAHGVPIETAILPHAWRTRLIAISNSNTRNVTGWCLEVNDLALSKYAAGREKDLDFTRVLATHGLTSKEILLARSQAMPVDEELKRVIVARIERDFIIN